MELREILAEGSFMVWLRLAEEIAKNHDVQVLRAPETCTMMLQAIDSVGQTPFYLGEVLMTEAAVAIGGRTGYGFALEDEPERAVCIAVIDAALSAGVAESDYIRKIIAAEAGRIMARRSQENGLVAATRVNFAIMEG
ncbi:MAG: phosphonate C-P lyase system protein PhnG [Negativicutes bacterium]|nr:phosphonate C-P lyase system protein PhnG [Negativicutes bacterium]